MVGDSAWSSSRSTLGNDMSSAILDGDGLCEFGSVVSIARGVEYFDDCLREFGGVEFWPWVRGGAHAKTL